MYIKIKTALLSTVISNVCISITSYRSSAEYCVQYVAEISGENSHTTPSRNKELLCAEVKNTSDSNIFICDIRATEELFTIY